jgi:pre-rRNA-processing protein TSR2
MATTSESTGPSPTQLLFARAVIYTFDLWPALRLAITEQWGGSESKAKADFLISYLCDQYSEEATSTSINGPASSSTPTQGATIAPTTPDVDDLADILEGYFSDEFESRLEDDSTDWVASRLVQLHKIIYSTFPPTPDSLATATAEIDKLEEAAIALRGRKVTAERTLDEENDSQSGSGSESEGDEDDAMEVDAAPPPARTSKPEPIVDEDGFTTVVKAKRR